MLDVAMYELISFSMLRHFTVTQLAIVFFVNCTKIDELR